MHVAFRSQLHAALGFPMMLLLPLGHMWSPNLNKLIAFLG